MARTDFLSKKLHLEKQDSRIPLAFAGKVEGYYTVVEITESGGGSGKFHIKIGVSTTDEENVQISESLLEEIKDKYNPKVINFDLNYLSITGYTPFRKRKFEELITGIITYSTSRLNELDILTGDFLNGHRDETISLYQVDNSFLFLSDESYQQVEEELNIKDKDGKPENKSIQAGLGGAVLGALVGAVIWGVLLYLGVYAWFAGVIGIHLAFKFYKQNNGLLSRAGIFAVVGVVISILLLTNYLLYSFIIYLGLQGFGISFFMILTNLTSILREVQLSLAFMLDNILGVGIAGIYSAIYAYRLYQESRNDGKIRKM